MELYQIMMISIIFAFVLIPVVVVLFLKFGSRLESPPPPERRSKPERAKWPYRKKDYLFNGSELTFYRILKIAIHGKLDLFSKVRLADVVYITGSEKYNKYNWYRIQAKHLDFLLCAPDGRPLLAIELDGSSHNAPDRIERDKFIDEMLEDAGLPLLRVNVAPDYDVENIKTLINEKISR